MKMNKKIFYFKKYKLIKIQIIDFYELFSKTDNDISQLENCLKYKENNSTINKINNIFDHLKELIENQF